MRPTTSQLLGFVAKTTCIFFLSIAATTIYTGCQPDQTLKKSVFRLPDDLKKICSTSIDKLDRNDRNVGDKIKEIIEGSGKLNIDNRRSFCADELADGMQKSMQVQKQRYQHAGLVYDIVVIGSGVHAAIFNATFAKKHPYAKVLVIDKSSIIASHFKSRAFRINSPVNFPVGQTNTFANAPVQLEDFIWFKPKEAFEGYPYAQALWNETIFTNFASNADFLLNTEVLDIKENPVDGQDYYLIATDRVGEISAKKIVITTGLGVPNFTDGPKDYLKEQKDLVEKCKYEDCLPSVMTFDDLLAIDAEWSLQYRKGMQFPTVVEALNNKNVALVGGADSSFVVLEYIYLTSVERLSDLVHIISKAGKEYYDVSSGVAPELISPKPAQLTWIGAPYDNQTDFNKLVDSGQIKARYRNLMTETLFVNSSYFPINYIKNTHLRRADPFGAGKARLTTVEKNGTNQKTIDNIDYTIIATGYNNSEVYKSLLKDLLNDQEKSKTWQELFPFIDVDGQRTARQLTTEKGAKEIYVIGTAAGTGGPVPDSQLATKASLDASITKNPASINVLGPYTERFANWLVQ